MAGHGISRHWLARSVVVAVLALAGAGAMAAGASAQPAAHAAARTATLIIRPASVGKYEVIVWVRARSKHSRVVHVYLTGQPMQTIRAQPWWGARVYYTLKLTGRKLTVRTVNPAPAVAVRASLILKKAVSTSPQVSTAEPTVTTTTTPPAPAPAPTPPPTTTPPPPPANLSPYTTPYWSDDFTSDFTTMGSQLPPASKWSLDNWGGCGTGTLSTTNTGNNISGVAATSNVSLTANGLAITAIPNGHGGYSSGQVDSAPITTGSGTSGFSTLDGEVEASIEMPPGQGLCPAFWMLSDNPVPGSSQKGEIDIVEAPTFTAGAPLSAFFTLHGPTQGTTDTQEFESDTTALGNLATGFHTYAVIWTATSITWTIDGYPYATANQSTLVAGSSWANYEGGNFHLIFDLAVGGWPCQQGPCAPQTAPSTQTMYVQWVKVLK